jgi:hypothetical protein
MAIAYNDSLPRKIYELTIPGCPDKYIGETGRYESRMANWANVLSSESAQANPDVLIAYKKAGGKFNMKVIASSDDAIEAGLLEAFYIHQLKDAKSALNSQRPNKTGFLDIPIGGDFFLKVHITRLGVETIGVIQKPKK